MAMRFDALDNLFDKCRAHLNEDGGKHWGTEIENYFVQLILIRICAEYEVRLKELMERRLRSNDDPTLTISRAMIRDKCKRFKITEISGILGAFGDNFQLQFSQKVSDEVAQIWDNINQGRQTVAHKTEAINLTFKEVEDNYRESLKIWDEIINALGFKQKELKGLR